MSQVNDEMSSDDSETPVYQWAQRINSVVSKAQGGQGPFRDRYLDIAVLAIRAIRAIDGAK